MSLYSAPSVYFSSKTTYDTDRLEYFVYTYNCVCKYKSSLKAFFSLYNKHHFELEEAFQILYDNEWFKDFIVSNKVINFFF